MENYLHHSLARNCTSSFKSSLAFASLQQLFPALIPKTKNTLHQIVEPEQECHWSSWRCWAVSGIYERGPDINPTNSCSWSQLCPSSARPRQLLLLVLCKLRLQPRCCSGGSFNFSVQILKFLRNKNKESRIVAKTTCLSFNDPKT